jgi:hypothetical protein
MPRNIRLTLAAFACLTFAAPALAQPAPPAGV